MSLDEQARVYEDAGEDRIAGQDAIEHSMRQLLYNHAAWGRHEDAETESDVNVKVCLLRHTQHNDTHTRTQKIYFGADRWCGEDPFALTDPRGVQSWTRDEAPRFEAAMGFFRLCKSRSS